MNQREYIELLEALQTFYQYYKQIDGRKRLKDFGLKKSNLPYKEIMIEANFASLDELFLKDNLLDYVEVISRREVLKVLKNAFHRAQVDLYLEACRIIRENPNITDKNFELIIESISLISYLPYIKSYLNKRRFNNLYKHLKEMHTLFSEALFFERYRIENNINYQELLLV